MSVRKSPSGLHRMPLEEWPVTDRMAWEAALRPGDVLEDCGLAAHLREGSRVIMIEGYGSWLGFLNELSEIDLERAPADRVSPKLVMRYVERLRTTCNDSTVHSRVRLLYQVLAVMAPDRDWRWLRRIFQKLGATILTRRDKQGRIVSSRRLYEAGLDFMRRAEAEEGLHAQRRAVMFRDGLLVALLAARPLRLSNIASIRIDQHLVRLGEEYWLRFDSNETKNARPIEVPVPDQLVPFLERYLERHRRELLGPSDLPHLWITVQGRAANPNTVYKRIVSLTKDAFGWAINPHLFRDCAATSVAIDDPEHIQIAAAILGHGSLKTTHKHYIQAQSVTASRRYGGTIANLRRRARESGSRRSA